MKKSLAVVCLSALATHAHADPAKVADDTVLGTVDVDGGGTAAALQKVALVPFAEKSLAEALAQPIVRRDLELSGLFDLAEAPVGPFQRDSPIDPKPWRAKGIDVLARVTVDELPASLKLRVDVWLLATGKAEPAYTRTVEVKTARARLGAHRIADAVLDAVTGRPGGFASQLAFTARVGKGQQVFLADADGVDLRGHGPAGDVALCPAFGPGDEVFYAASVDFGPFGLVRGPLAVKVPLPVAGSVLGLAFDAPRARLALAVMSDGASQIWVGDAAGKNFESKTKAAFANHPVFGPLGRMAWVAGSPPRVFVDGKAVSPAGFAANAPVFCDSPRGVLVVFTVGVGKDTDLVATDTAGGGLLRLTQGQGANTYPACSPDGRLVAFFSTRTAGKGAGLYSMPLSAPARAQRLTPSQGESLRWAAITAE